MSAGAISKTTQISKPFENILAILQTNSTLTNMFGTTKSKWLQYEPVGRGVPAYPYVVIHPPVQDTIDKTLISLRKKAYSVKIEFFHQYFARMDDDGITLRPAKEVDAAINVLETASNQDTLESYGMKNIEIVNGGVTQFLKEGTEVIVGELTLNFWWAGVVE